MAPGAAACLAAALLVIGAIAQGAVVQYTDRTAWERAALSMGFLLEKETLDDLSQASGLDGGVAEGPPASFATDAWDFLANSYLDTPTARFFGEVGVAGINHMSGQTGSGNRNVNGTNFIRGEGSGAGYLRLRTNAIAGKVAAIGIEFNHGYGWSFSLSTDSGTLSYSTPNNTVGFVGWIDDTGARSLDALRVAGGTNWGQIGIDNLTIAYDRPVKGGLLLVR